MMKKIIALILTVLLLASVFAGCAKHGSAAVIGRWAWKYEGLGEVLSFTFNPDGTGTMESFGDSKPFTYTATDSKISMTIGESTDACEYTIDGDEMTLTVNGEALKLTKTD